MVRAKSLSSSGCEPAIANLAKALMRTLKVVETPAMFGFAQHPRLLAIAAADEDPQQPKTNPKIRHRQLAEAIQNIVYRCDIDSQFVGRLEIKEHEQASKAAAQKLQPSPELDKEAAAKSKKQEQNHHCQP